MSNARLVHVLSILQQGTNEHKTMTLHEICEKLGQLYPEEQCSEQGVRRDLSLLESLSAEKALSVQIESRSLAHNQRSSQTVNRKWRFQAIYRHLCTKDVAIQKARGAF